MKLFLKLAPFAVLLLLFCTTWAYWKFLSQEQKVLELGLEINSNEDVSLASLIDMVDDNRVVLNTNWFDGELGILAAPPWTTLDKADLAKLVAGGGQFSGFMPDLPPQEKKKRRDDAFDNKKKISKYFPYMYTGGMQVGNEYHALIEDADTGASYFRKLGDKLGTFSVVEVSRTVVTIVHDKNGKQVRLLKRAGNTLKKNNPDQEK